MADHDVSVSVAACVLGNCFLLNHIVAYQDGIHGDLLPLFELRRHLVEVMEQAIEVDIDIAFRQKTVKIVMDPFKNNWLRKVVKKATLNGFTEWVQRVVACVPKVATPQLVDIAAKQGNLPLIEFLHKHGVRGTTDAMDSAQSLQVVEFLHENKYSCTTAAMDIAALRGALDIVEFLHNNRKEGCTVLAMDFAASNGHLSVLKFLHDHRKEGCTAKAMELALKRQHEHIVMFLHQHRHEHAHLDVIGMAKARGLHNLATLIETNDI